MADKKKKPVLEDYASVEAMCDGVPVYSFNHLVYVHGQSPDFYPDIQTQAGNTKPISKIKLKKSWEIKNNYIGFCNEMVPRTRLNDSQPFLPIHLIDGDPETIWASFEMFAPDTRDEWIRIDLPMESDISSITLTTTDEYMGLKKGGLYRPQWYWGHAWPKELKVQFSKDAWHWDTVFECADIHDCGASCCGDQIFDFERLGAADNPDRITIIMKETHRAKQILITGKDLSKIGYEGFMFSITGVEVRDPAGRNLALVSNGAGVTVSSTSNAHNSERYGANSLWGPLQYDIGGKWVAAGRDNGSLLWYFIEHEKGKLVIDADIYKAISEAVDNGINLIMTLDFNGNWIYEDPPRKTDWLEARYREINDSYICPSSLVTDNPEMFRGYLRYVEYMVEILKDKATYFEVGNEWHGWKDNLNWYKNEIFEPTYDMIKQTDPDAKVKLCGTGGYLDEDILICLDAGVIAESGKLAVPGRTMITTKDKVFGNVTVSMDVSCDSPFGVVLRYKDKNSFLAAMYEPDIKEIYVLECVGNNAHQEKDMIAKYTHKGTVSVSKLEGIINLKVKSDGKTIIFTAADRNQTASTSFDIEDCEDEGGAGFIQYPGKGVLSNFHVTDAAGNILFADDFTDNNGLKDRWHIDWNHWGDPSKPTAAKRLAAVGWHPANIPDNEYFASVRAFRKKCEALGFKGEYLASEIYAGSGYPPGPVEGNQYRLTDIGEAKFHTRCMSGHGSLNIEVGPCHTHFTGFPHPQAICRATVPSQVTVPNQPKPSYYTIRNLATIMDDFYEADFKVKFSDDVDIVHFTLENGDKTELMINTFLEKPWSDAPIQKKVDITVCDVSVKTVWGMDSFNGTEQELDISSENGNTIIKGVILKDYPVFLKLRMEVNR